MIYNSFKIIFDGKGSIKYKLVKAKGEIEKDDTIKNRAVGLKISWVG